MRCRDGLVRSLAITPLLKNGLTRLRALWRFEPVLAETGLFEVRIGLSRNHGRLKAHAKLNSDLEPVQPVDGCSSAPVGRLCGHPSGADCVLVNHNRR